MNKIKSWFVYQPLKRKLLWLVMAVVLITTTSTLSFLYWQTVKQQRDDFIRTNISLAKLVADFVILPVVFNDSDGALEQLSKLLKDPRVTYVQLKKNNGKLLTYYDPNNFSSAAPSLNIGEEWRLQNNQLYFALPLKHNNEPLAVLSGAFRLDELKLARLKEQRFMLTVLSIATLFSYFVAVMLQRFVMTPIRTLEGHARRIAANLDEQNAILPHEHGNDEIGNLYEAFNGLMSRIKQREQEILHLNYDLEVKITERTRALEESRHILALCLQGSGQRLWDWNIATGVLQLDDELIHLCSAIRPSILTMDWFNAQIHPDDRVGIMLALQDFLNGHRSLYSVEFRLGTADGEHRWLFSQGQIIERNTQGAAVRMIGTFLDITETKVNALVLAKAKDSADQANQAKSEFLANMSHEIRTPMNAVLSLSYLALKTNLNPKQRDYLFKIHTAANGLLGIINDILDFSKIEAGQLKIEQIAFNLADVLNNVMSISFAQAAEKDIKMSFLLNPCLPMLLYGDPLRLSQILLNLINNAIKFTQQGSVIVSIKKHHVKNNNLELLCEVSDTGIGIDHAALTGLFKSFSQVDTSTTRRFGGTGLGLAISKQLVEQMGGTITVESEAGVGSVFKFTVLLTIQTTGHVTPLMTQFTYPVEFNCHACLEEECEYKLGAKLSGLKILIVDNDPRELQTLTDLLKNWAIKVTWVASCLEAVALLAQTTAQAEDFDLVLMDYQSADIDKSETAQLLKDCQSLAQLPLIMMVSADPQQLNQYEKILDIAAVLVKPISSSILFSTIITLTSALPLKQESKSEPHDDYPMLKGCHVLLAEDNKINQQIAVELLTEVGVSLDSVENGYATVDAVLKHPADYYDAILMDVQMPGMDGIEATRQIRKSLPHIPIIAMTAHAMIEEKQRCYRAGMNDHVAKPVEPKVLYATLARWIKTKHHLLPLIAAPDTKPSNEILPEQLLPFDIPAALLRVNGKKALLRKLIADFYYQYRDALDKLKLANRDEALLLMHTLKGIASTLELAELFQAAKNVETALREVLIDELPDLTEKLAAALNPALAVAFSLASIPVTDSEKKLAIEIHNPTELIEELESLLATNSMKAKKCFKVLESVLPTGLDDKLIVTLAEQINSLDFDAAKKTLHALKQLLSSMGNES